MPCVPHPSLCLDSLLMDGVKMHFFKRGRRTLGAHLPSEMGALFSIVFCRGRSILQKS